MIQKATQVLMVFVLLLIFLQRAEALTLNIPSDLAPLVVSDSVPFVLPPADLKADDFKVIWAKPSDQILDVQWSLGHESLEWVRVLDILAVPRARLIMDVKNAESAQLHTAGRVQIFSRTADGVLHGEIPVALLSGDENTIELKVKRSGRVITSRMKVQFHPQQKNNADKPRIFTDVSCSPYGVIADQVQLSQNSWVYVGCRIVKAKGDAGKVPVLEMVVVWSGVGQKIILDGIETQSIAASAWAMSLKSEPGRIQFQSLDGQKFDLSYRVGKKFHMANLGLGLGPYHYRVIGAGQNYKGLAPILTLYFSYFLDETSRMVAFNATAIHKHFYSDTGIYYHFEQFRAWDKRFSFNLLLGARSALFNVDKTYYQRTSAPQGIEMVYRDLFKKNYNFSLGAFLYPTINDKSYYNVWLRWGTRGMFIEANYISWSEPVGEGRSFLSQSAGVCIGYPLFQFL